MNEDFIAYHPLNESDLVRFIKSATLSLDTNFILNLFRFEKKHRDALLSLFAVEEINDRILITHHAALEFYENLEDVASEPLTKFDDVVKIIKGFKKEHFNLNSEGKEKSIYSGLYGKISKELDRLIREVELEKKSIKSSFNKREILQEIEKIFNGKVGKPFEFNEIKPLVKKCLERYESKIPPGYGKDENKPGAYSFCGETLPKKCGDFFIWEQMLRDSEDEGRPVLFISDDEKSDWIKKSKQGPLPRPELRIEARNRTGNDFYIVNTKRFLSLASKAYQIGIKASQVNEIGEIAKRQGNWKDEVYNAMRQLGGEADLKEIYDRVKENREGNVPASFESIVRKAIYHYAPETDIFLNKEKLYQQVSSGRWRIRQAV
jgi:hypothetical protein